LLGVDESADFEPEEGVAFPVGDGVAVYTERVGDGIGGVAGNEEEGGAELIGSEWPRRAFCRWVRFAHGV
jgi:hypothetical protein